MTSMRDEVKGIITEKCANAHCRVLELDSIGQAGTEEGGKEGEREAVGRTTTHIRDYKLFRYFGWSPYIILQYRNI